MKKRRLRNDPQYDQEGYVESCHEPSVYFLQAGDAVKIGHTNNINRRIGNLQPGNPVRLKLLGLIPGPRALEKSLHTQFALNRILGEWYEATPALLAFIKRYRKDIPT